MSSAHTMLLPIQDEVEDEHVYCRDTRLNMSFKKDQPSTESRPYLYEPIARLIKSRSVDSERKNIHCTSKKPLKACRESTERKRDSNTRTRQSTSKGCPSSEPNQPSSSYQKRATEQCQSTLVHSNICHTASNAETRNVMKVKSKLFCFSLKHASTLCILGAGYIVTGFLLGIGFFSVVTVTSSVQHAEPSIPTYVSAATMILCGLLSVITARKNHKFLILTVVILSIVCTIFCFFSLVYLATTVAANLAHLESCTFNSRVKMCSCYVSSGQNKKELHFEDVANCGAVKESLKELVYGVCVLFSIGLGISFTTIICSSYLLYKKRKKRNQRRSAIARTLGDGSTTTSSATTQTQESSFTIPVRWTLSSSPHQKSKNYSKSEHSPQRHQRQSEAANSDTSTLNSSTVSTQTPMFMMPVAQLVYDIQEQRGDYNLGLLIRGRDDPPPPYSAAVGR